MVLKENHCTKWFCDLKKRWKQINNKKKNSKGEEEEGKKGEKEEEKKENNLYKKNWKKLDHSWITQKWEALISILISRAVQDLTALLEGFQFGDGQCPAGMGHGREISRLSAKHREEALCPSREKTRHFTAQPALSTRKNNISERVEEKFCHCTAFDLCSRGCGCGSKAPSLHSAKLPSPGGRFNSCKVGLGSSDSSDLSVL